MNQISRIESGQITVPAIRPIDPIAMADTLMSQRGKAGLELRIRSETQTRPDGTITEIKEILLSVDPG